METEDLKKINETADLIINRAPCVINAGRHVYKVKQIGNTVRTKISLLEKEIYILDEEGKKGVPLKRAQKIDRKMRTLHSKTAAYYILGNWALFVPFLWSIVWRIIDLRNSEDSFQINSAGMNNKDMDFFLANWQITKAQLALSTRLVGEGVNQYQERKESAENMLDEDAFGTKQDSK